MQAASKVIQLTPAQLDALVVLFRVERYNRGHREQLLVIGSDATSYSEWHHATIQSGVGSRLVRMGLAKHLGDHGVVGGQHLVDYGITPFGKVVLDENLEAARRRKVVPIRFFREA